MILTFDPQTDFASAFGNENVTVSETKKLDAFLVKGNKKLANLAFEACDKEEFAQRLLEEKLQKYDVKAYKKQRAINHGAAKKIFKQVTKDDPFGYIIVKRDAKMHNLNDKRKKFICTPTVFRDISV